MSNTVVGYIVFNDKNEIGLFNFMECMDDPLEKNFGDPVKNGFTVFPTKQEALRAIHNSGLDRDSVKIVQITASLDYTVG